MSAPADNHCRAIKRIVFESVAKWNGSNFEVIDDATLKQIAGRAGRYRTAAQIEEPAGNLSDDGATLRTSSTSAASTSLGLVTTLEPYDLPVLRKAMQSEMDPIMSAGIFPPTNILTRFATYFPPMTSFSYIILRLHELSLKHPRYHLCNLRDQLTIADIIQPIQNLTVHDRIIFCASPANPREECMRPIVEAFARCVGKHSSGALLDIEALPLDVLNENMRPNRDYMARLEALHKALILYLWLSFRFAGVFTDQAMASYVKRLVEDKIDKVLAEYSASSAIRQKIRQMREEALRQVSAGPSHIEIQNELLGTPLTSHDVGPPEQGVEDGRMFIEEQLANIDGSGQEQASVPSP